MVKACSRPRTREGRRKPKWQENPQAARPCRFESGPGHQWSKAHRDAQRSRLDKEILPYIGATPIRDVTPGQVLELLTKIHRRGAFEVANKCKVIVSQVSRYAVVPAGLEVDPTAMLRGRLKRPRPVEHRKKVGEEEMPALFKALSEVPAENITKLALYWLILTAARTGEMRFAPWSEIATGKGGKIWRIPGERMKMDREHIVPLSKQAQQILELAKPIRTPDTPDALIFPGFTRQGSLSENALLALLARAGYFGRQTGHGFRANFSTWAHETAEANPDVIELCLAHVAGDIRGVYNDAKYLPQRRALLQQWADQCVEWGMKFPE
jgi:integrase